MRVQQSLQMLHILIEESESLGNGGLKPITSLNMRCNIRLHFLNQFDQMRSDMPEEFFLQVNTNTTMIELQYMVS